MSDAVAEPATQAGARTTPKRAYTRRTAADAKNQGASSSGDRAESPRVDQGEEVLSRKSRGELMAGGLFDIPRHRRKPGWDYQGWTLTVHGEPITGPGLSQADAYSQGWRPVPASEIPELVEPGSTATNIVRNGQILMWRPLHLTQDARREDYEAAEQQRRDRIEGALSGKPRGVEGLANIRGVEPRPLELHVEGEMGSYASSPLRRRE